MKKNLIFVAILSFVLFSCQEKNEDVVKELSKNGSIEHYIEVKHFPTYELLITTDKVWLNGNIDKTITHIDTLKTIGFKSEKISIGSHEEKYQEEDDDGNLQTYTETVEDDSTIIIPKQYKIYIPKFDNESIKKDSSNLKSKKYDIYITMK